MSLIQIFALVWRWLVLSRYYLLALLPSSMLTAKPLSLWETVCVAETLLIHLEMGHQHSASHLCVLQPMSCNTAWKCISNVFFYRLYGRTDAGYQDDKWPHFGNPKTQEQWDRNECSISQTIHPRKKLHLVYKQEVSNFALILNYMKKHNSLNHINYVQLLKSCTINVQFSTFVEMLTAAIYIGCF